MHATAAKRRLQKAQARLRCGGRTQTHDPKIPLRPWWTKRPASSRRRERGLALIMVLTTVAILTALVAQLHERTSTDFAMTRLAKQRLQAEYLARSAVNLTRMLIAREPQVRQLIGPVYQALVRRAPPQIPIWKFANMILQPFCRPEGAGEAMAAAGFSLDLAEGLGELPGECEIVALAENSRLNVNDPLLFDGESARNTVATQLFGLMAMGQNPNPYDELFAKRDPDGLLTQPADVLHAIIDWWDDDTLGSSFNPTTREVGVQGGEQDVYARFTPPYTSKNAPFDSLEELRMVRGVGDSFWVNFVDPDPSDPERRLVTVYGTGTINPNEAPPELLLAQLCGKLPDTTLCTDALEAAKLTQLITTARSVAPLPFFGTGKDFVTFLEGKGGKRDLYPMLKSFVGEGSGLLFAPIAIADSARQELEALFSTSSWLVSIYATGFVGQAQTRIHAVVNFDPRWVPPPPNAGSLPGLGVMQYYRED